MFDSLRDFIRNLDELGELRRVDGADWNVSSPEFIDAIKNKWGKELDLKF